MVQLSVHFPPRRIVIYLISIDIPAVALLKKSYVRTAKLNVKTQHPGEDLESTTIIASGLSHQLMSSNAHLSKRL